MAWHLQILKEKCHMKRLILIFSICYLGITAEVTAQTTTYSSLTDSTGMPGDNFSLQGALELFKTSKSPEDFEKKLNTEDNYVNNLDMNHDGKTDYVKIINKKDGNAQAMILRVDISKTESQDVAVIEIEKQGDKSAMLQIIGDEELYGDTAIIEPIQANEKSSTGAGPTGNDITISNFFVNVWYWPCVTYIYQPTYVVYVSPWYWDYYPYWWSSWYVRPWYIHHHHCYDYYYYGYAPVYVYRNHVAHNMYYGHRSYSPSVHNYYSHARTNYRAARTEHGRNYNNMNGTHRDSRSTNSGVSNYSNHRNDANNQSNQIHRGSNDYRNTNYQRQEKPNSYNNQRHDNNSGNQRVNPSQKGNYSTPNTNQHYNKTNGSNQQKPNTNMQKPTNSNGNNAGRGNSYSKPSNSQHIQKSNPSSTGRSNKPSGSNTRSNTQHRH
jgi:hypothetical protein